MIPKPFGYLDRTCSAVGLVGPQGYLVRDPSEYRIPTPPFLGCNRLYCLGCRKRVKVEPDPVQTGRKGRRYRCGCRALEVLQDFILPNCSTMRKQLGFPDWVCGSHPPPTFPFVVDGFEIGENTDFYRLIRHVFSGGLPDTALVLQELKRVEKVPPKDRKEKSLRRKMMLFAPVHWVLSLLARVAGTWAQEAIGDGIYRCLTESTSRDPCAVLIRARALECYPTPAADPWIYPWGFRRLAQILDGDMAGFKNIENPLERGFLDEHLRYACEWCFLREQEDDDD